jgi:uncharacterized membrane protein
MRHRFFRRRRPEIPPSSDELTRKNVEAIARLEKEADAARPGSDRFADWIAQNVGSWRFVIAQSVLLALYTALNIFAWARHWDPYPFILLNLLLNIQAAYTGPIIMMSQNRQSKIDTRRNHLDLQINLLAEQETTEILRLLRQLCERQGIPVEGQSLQGLEERIHPGTLLRQIEQEQARVAPPAA